MSEPQVATCLCGAATVKFSGPAAFFVKCYCEDCQKISGGSHLPQLAVQRDGFESSGPIGQYSYLADSGHTVTTHFCSSCGSPMFKTTTKLADKVFIAAGALDGADEYPNAMPVYEERKPAWEK